MQPRQRSTHLPKMDKTWFLTLLVAFTFVAAGCKDNGGGGGNSNLGTILVPTATPTATRTPTPTPTPTPTATAIATATATPDAGSAHSGFDRPNYHWVRSPRGAA
jgi:hypothetical protein